jgi:hypothetical protein
MSSRRDLLLLATVVVVVPLALVAVAGASGSKPLSFAARKLLAATPNPAGLAIGDLNGDGKPDLAVANGTVDSEGEDAVGTVSIRLNRGDGTFEPRRDYNAGSGPAEIAIGDLNGDGAADLAVVSNSESSVVSVFFNDGRGAFAGRRDYAAGREPVSVAIGDLNDDGKPDLAISHFGSVFRSNAVSVLVNDGRAGFGSKRDYPVAEGFGRIAIGDVSGDGKPDLVTSNDDSNRLSLLVNAGGGRFLPVLAYPTGELPQDVALGDLNGDGRLDLVSADSLEDVSNDLTVILSKPGFCDVQNVVKLPLAAARAKLARAGCSAGKVRSSYSKTTPKGLVSAQRPAFGAVLPGGAKVSLVLSKGCRR